MLCIYHKVCMIQKFPSSGHFSHKEKAAKININQSRKNGETEPKQKQQPVVDVTGGGSKA